MPARKAAKPAAKPVDIAPMEAKLVEALPDGPGWQFEPKWDGFRCLAFRDGDDVELRAKSGKPLTRYFPEVVEALRALPKAKQFVFDGELAIPVGDALSFDALQLRLHPAESRARKLAAETPAVLILFDCLLDTRGRSLIPAPLSERREALEKFFSGGPSRWSTERTTEWEPLEPRLVVEVRYDHVAGDRFRHGTRLLRWRPDKSPQQCTFEHLQPPARPGKLINEVLRRDGQRVR